MATFITSQYAKAQRAGISLTARYATFSFITEAGTVVGDRSYCFKLPQAATIVDAILACDDCDTNGTPTLALTVGDVGDTARIITTSTVGQTGGVVRSNLNGSVSYGLNYSYVADINGVDIFVRVSASAATAAAGTCRLVILYTMQQ